MKTIEKSLWPGGPWYKGESFGTDSLCLAAQCAPPAGSTGCDLGCGCGILMLLLLARQPSLHLTGIELHAETAEQCRENLSKNGWASRTEVLTGDFRSIAPDAGSMDFALSNPPYFPVGRGKKAPDHRRALIRTESATLTELCAAAFRLLKPGGSFALVHRAERRKDVFAALLESGLAPFEFRWIAWNEATSPSLFLCRALKGISEECRTLPTICQRDGRGNETPEYRKICHWEA